MKIRILLPVVFLFCLTAPALAGDKKAGLEPEAGSVNTDSGKIAGKIEKLSQDASIAEKREMKLLVKEELRDGVETDNILRSLDVLKEAVNKGSSPSEARLKVALAVHNAKAEGLKGKELAARIHEIQSQLREKKGNTNGVFKAKREEKEEKIKEKKNERVSDDSRKNKTEIKNERQENKPGDNNNKDKDHNTDEKNNKK